MGCFTNQLEIVVRNRDLDHFYADKVMTNHTALVAIGIDIL